MSPSIAIIMRAKNEMPHVQRALERLKSQTIHPIPLFAVDSGSSDGTLEVLKEHGVELTRIKSGDYVPGKVLNDAISRAPQDIIVLLNADAVPQSDDWLEQLVLPIIGNRADATFSKQIARPDARFIVSYDYERAYNPEKMDPGFFSAVSCAFRRDLWEQTRFPDRGYAEDVAWAGLCITEGARFQLVESSVVEHSHNYTLEGLHQKRYRQALTFNEVPNIGKQIYRCCREIVRDFLFAISRLKFQTIPYNIAYRITIHRALYQGTVAAFKSGSY
jgi:rhamnosyltransferase